MTAGHHPPTDPREATTNGTSIGWHSDVLHRIRRSLADGAPRRARTGASTSGTSRGPGSEQPKRILVISASGLGDTLLATPMFASVRKRFPESSLEFFTIIPCCAEVARAVGVFDRVMQHDLMGASPFSSAKAILALRRRRYDLCLVAFPSNRAHYNILAALVGARRTIGHEYLEGSSMTYGRFLLSDRVHQGRETHAVVENLKLAVSLGCEELVPTMRCGHLGFEHQAWIEGILGPRPGPVIGLHPGCSTQKNHQMRRWPADRFDAFMGRVLDSTGGTAVLVLGPDDEDIELPCTTRRSDVVVIRNASVGRVAAAVRACDVFVSSDSGVGHLAVSCGVPAVQILGPTHPAYIRPWAVPHRVVVGSRPCSPCFEYSRSPLQCRSGGGYACLRQVSVDRVLDACLELLEEAPSRLPPIPSGEARPRVRRGRVGQASGGVTAARPQPEMEEVAAQ